jgi:hypothetical protein
MGSQYNFPQCVEKRIKNKIAQKNKFRGAFSLAKKLP